MSLCCGGSPEGWGLAVHSLRCHWPRSLATGGASERITEHQVPWHIVELKAMAWGLF